MPKKPKNYRWVCVQCGKGKLAPSRLRTNDVRRYCLPCSKKTGVLVERTVPVLEKKRAAKRAESQAKAAKKAKAKRERERPRKERKRRQERRHQTAKSEKQKWRERYTRVVTTRPDDALYMQISQPDHFRKMGVTVLRWEPPGRIARPHYAPRWASYLRAMVEQLALDSDRWLRELGRFVTKTAGIEDAVIAVHAAEPRRVLPFIVSQYNLPGLPDVLRETAAEIEADLAGEESPLLRFNREAARELKTGIVRKMVSP